MEDNNNHQLKNIIEIIKAFKKNNDTLKKDNNLNFDLFNLLNQKKNDENKDKIYSTFKYNKIYIVNKEPIDKIMEILHFDEFDKFLKDNLKNKEIKKFSNNIFKNKYYSLNYGKYIRNIQYYYTSKKINEIIEKNGKIIFINEEILKALRVDNNLYNKKHVTFAKRNQNILIYFPEECSSIMINLSLLSDKISQDNQNKNDNNNISIDDEDKKNLLSDNEMQIDNNVPNQNNDINNINNINNQNNINNLNKNVILKEYNFINNEVDLKQKIEQNLTIVQCHLNYLNLINQLQSFFISDINDINQIENNIMNNNNINCVINCYLIDSDNFNSFEKEIFYDCYQTYLFANNENERNNIYNTLCEKMKSKNNNEQLKNELKIINNYQEYSQLINGKKDTLFTFVDDGFCSSINMDKNAYGIPNTCLFKANNELFLYFKDQKKIMKVVKMNNYYKITVNFGNMVNIPKDILNDLITLYEETKKINELIDDDIKELNFKQYYLINKNWLKQYKQYYNFEEITIKYEEQNYEDYNSDDKNNNYDNNNKNNFGTRERKNKYNTGIAGLSKNQKKRIRKKNNKNQKKIQQNFNTNISKNNNKNNKKIDMQVQYNNIDYPKYLIEENNIIPNIQFNICNYPTEFDLIEISTLDKILNHLNIKLSPSIKNKIIFNALLGDNRVFLKEDRISNNLEIFESKGDKYFFEYLIIFDQNDFEKKAIEIIKEKGIDKYLLDMSLNLNDKSLQYLIDEECTTNIGKLYIINKQEINYNNYYSYDNNNSINFINNIINYDSNNNNDNINNNNYININFDYSNNKNYNLLPYRLGLNNIGATCYMNATIQCLCNIVQLQHFFFNNSQNIKSSHKKLSNSFCNVMQNLYDFKKNKKSYSPKNFKETISHMNPLFKGVAANDSKDLILFLFEKIHEELNIQKEYIISDQNIPYELKIFRENYYSKNSSIIEKTFYYEIKTINQCSNCGNQLINYSIQNIIIFPLEKIRLNCIQKYGGCFFYVNLQECFEQISLPELMQGMNNIYCNNCCRNSSCLYINQLNTCPEVMTIILNRGKGNEFEVEFDFPLRIDINDYVVSKDKCTIYDLVGVLVHTGGSDMSGHFFAFCKSNIDNNWYLYNDSIVSKCSDNYEYEIKNKGLPYVLFYQNINCLNNNNLNNNNNDNITLYFKTIYGKEKYLDVNNNDLFCNVIQKLAQKYNNCNIDYMKVNYFVSTYEGQQIIDYNNNY